MVAKFNKILLTYQPLQYDQLKLANNAHAKNMNHVVIHDLVLNGYKL